MTKAQMALIEAITLNAILGEVSAERIRQDETWGQQDHPNGTGGHVARKAADEARADCKRAAVFGNSTWRLILAEEVAEAFAENDTEILRVELIQVAAVAVAWVAAIDRGE